MDFLCYYLYFTIFFHFFLGANSPKFKFFLGAFLPTAYVFDTTTLLARKQVLLFGDR